jgi:Transposase DNA-binding/Transposase Tn5 dimerisation domain
MSKRSEEGWVKREIEGCEFGDRRLGRRFEKVLSALSGQIGSSLSVACQDWANTKAAYRFLANERVSEREILAGHFQATRDRVAATQGPLLVLHDTTEFSFKRQEQTVIGLLRKLPMQSAFGAQVVACGILMHSSLVVTTDGVPLGLSAIKFWTRKRFKGTDALKRKINPTRVPIETKESIRWLENLQYSTALVGEPQRCIHIGDRESDIYELFCLAQEQNTQFLFRLCVDRVAGDGTSLISTLLAHAPVQGHYCLQVTDKQGKQRKAKLEIKFLPLVVHPPLYKKRAYPELTLTVIEARERGPVKNAERIVWKLLTNLPVRSLRSAIEKLSWYALRWKIETFHKILKSGCRAEESRLRTAERLVNLLAIFCILSWRVFWITMLRRAAPLLKASVVFTQAERQVLQYLQNKNALGRAPLDCYILQLAKLGGYLARATDPPPGTLVIWRGLSRLTDIQLGFSLFAKSCG